MVAFGLGGWLVVEVGGEEGREGLVEVAEMVEVVYGCG